MQEASATPTPEQSTEQLLREEIIQRIRLARIAEVNAREIWDFSDLALISGIPGSTLEQFIRRWPVKGAFTIGRKRYVTSTSGRAWLEEIAEANAYDGPKALNPRGQK